MSNQSARTQALLGVEPSWGRNFDHLSFEWRRSFAEFLGTFSAGLGGSRRPGGGRLHPRWGEPGRLRGGTGLDGEAIIMFMGLVSGAHLNPVVTLAFALRQEFPWRPIPGPVSPGRRIGAGLPPALGLDGEGGHVGSDRAGARNR